MSAKSSLTLVEKMAKSQLFCQFQSAFEVVTALPLTLREAENRQLVAMENRNLNHYCARLCQTRRPCALCVQSQPCVCKGATGFPDPQVCAFGLYEIAVEVRIGKEIVAQLQSGQVLFKTPTREQTKRTLQHLRDWSQDLNPGDTLRVCFKNQKWPDFLGHLIRLIDKQSHENEISC